MQERGPDDATLERNGNVVFAHRRLAIRDQAAGRQPLYSPDGRYLIVYNGEIYNDSRLRKELRREGFSFRGNCDTEVLAAAWQRWRQDCIPMLRGMFAFAVHDGKTDELWLVRDRFGIKPLFYTKVGKEWVFASSIASIVEHPGLVKRPELEAIRHYLSTFRLTLDAKTVYEDVLTVRPAEQVHIANGQVTRASYWSAPAPEEKTDLCFEEAVDQLEATLRESIQLRLNSDVPVGMMLSGGVDSNSLAFLMREETSSGFHATCGVGKSSQFGSADAPFARDCAQANGLEFDQVEVDSEGYLQDWEKLIRHYGTPVSTPSDVIINQIAHRLKRYVGVALGGEGADEACCGYEIPHWSGADFDLWTNSTNLDRTQSETARKSLLSQYGGHEVETPGDFYLACNGLIPRGIQSRFFRPEHWSAADRNRGVEKYYDRLFHDLPEMPNVEKSAHVLLKTNLESLLARLDSATMQASLESRVPFTDHLLVEQLFRLPLSYRIDISPQEKTPWLSSFELSSRGSLRPKRMIHAMAGRLMPERFAQRKKSSFSTPVPTWLNDDWKETVDQRIGTSPFLGEYFEPEALSFLKHLPQHLSVWKWPIANLAMWGDAQFG